MDPTAKIAEELKQRIEEAKKEKFEVSFNIRFNNIFKANTSEIDSKPADSAEN